MNTTDPLSLDDVFKVHVYDVNGIVTKVFIFAGGQLDDTYLHQLFTSETLTAYERNNVQYIFSEHQLYRDDTIETVKRKLLANISNVSYEDLYLFCWKRLSGSLDETVPFSTFLRNVDLSTSMMEQCHSYETFYKQTVDQDVHHSYPMGNNKAYGPSIVKNPFLVTVNPVVSSTVEDEKENDTRLLLNYGEITERSLFLCCVNDVLNVLENSELTSLILHVYFPYVAEKRTINRPLTALSMTSIDRFHHAYYQRKEDLLYMSRGIMKFTMIMKSGNNHHRRWPLEVIFKQLHASKEVPLLLLNPGKQRENIVRLFCTKMAKNGKRIPHLSHKEISKISMDIGHSLDTLSAFLDLKNDEQEIFVKLTKYGEVIVRCESTTPLSTLSWNELLIQHLNPYLRSINDVIQQAGYSTNIFHHLRDEELRGLVYKSTLSIQDRIDIARQLPCLTDVFDIYNDSISNSHTIYLRYKRSSYYNQEIAQNHLIQFLQKHHQKNVNDTIVRSLKINYSLSEQEAMQRLSSFNEPRMDTKIMSGFPVILKLEDKTLIIQSEEITSVDYLAEIELYIDVLLRVTQHHLTEFTDADKLLLCSSSTTHEPIPPVELNANDTNNTTSPVIPYDGTMLGENFVFDDDNEDMEEVDQEEVLPEPKDQDQDQDQLEVDGLPLTSYFLKRLQKRDPALFEYNESDGYKLYSRVCQASSYRQPVILTKEEYEDVEQNYRDSYTQAMKHGSNEDNQHYFICPRYWCLKTGRPMTEEEVRSKSCGDIIPRNSKRVPSGAYVYEFDSQKEGHRHLDGKYALNTPDLLTTTNPSGIMLPCCRKMSKEKRKTYDEKQTDTGDIKYIKNELTFPIPSQRWGYLPIPIQQFLRTNNSLSRSKKNPALIATNKPCFLRYGVEHSETQSFLGCMADLYAYAQEGFVGQGQEGNIRETSVPSIQAFRSILTKHITIDRFTSFHQGTLVTTFKQSSDDAIENGINHNSVETSIILPQLQEQQRNELITSYHRFLAFLQEPQSVIDHTYLWDAVTEDNPNLIPGGFNLVILQILDNDPTDNFALVCPTNSTYPSYDVRKPTAILIKKGNTYEPIYHYVQLTKARKIIKLFAPNRFENITQVMSLIQQSTRTHCAAQPSCPKVYKFGRNVLVKDVEHKLKSHDFVITHQVINYSDQVIGLSVEPGVVIPCLPSGIIQETRIKYMDDDTLWKDYVTTCQTLNLVHEKTGLPCLPQYNILDDGMVVGILTSTNQFVHVLPQMENVDTSVLPNILHADYAVAEKTTSTSQGPDTERTIETKKLQLESQFYSAFRIAVRMKLHLPEHRSDKEQIIKCIEMTSSHNEKMSSIVPILRKLVLNRSVVFQEIANDVVFAFADIVGCVSNHSQPYCLTRDNEEPMLLIPKTNLIHGLENERVYFARLGDELLRYRRIRIFMLDTSLFYHSVNVQYRVYANELLCLLSMVDKTGTYFDDVDEFYVDRYAHTLTNLNAQPASHVEYTNIVTLEDQKEMTESTNSTDQLIIPDQLSVTKKESPWITAPIRMNRSQAFWIFPKEDEQMEFPAATNYGAIQHILSLEKHPYEMKDIQSIIANSTYVNVYGNKMVRVWKNQGKSKLMQDVVSNKKTLRDVIMSDGYYLTDLDMWILSSELKLPVLLFSGVNLKAMVEDVKWLFLSSELKDIENPLYMLWSHTSLRTMNEPPQYILITPSHSYTKLKNNKKDCEGKQQIDQAILENRLITIEQFFEENEFPLPQVIVRKGAPKG